MQHTDAEAAFHDAGHNSVLKAAAAFVSVDGTSQAKSQKRKWATAAQQLHALRIIMAPQLHRRLFKRALRWPELELRRRLQIMRGNAAAAEDAAGGCGVQHKTHGVANLRNG